MAHPFMKMFYKALNKSSLEDNLLLEEAERLMEKGYRVEEIYEVLQKLQKGLIDTKDNEIATEALEEFREYLNE